MSRLGHERHEFGQPLLSSWLAYGDDARVTDSNGFWSLDTAPPLEHVDLSIRLEHPDYVHTPKPGELQYKNARV